MLEVNQNTGVLWREPQPQDDIAGGESRVVYEVRVEDGQHDSYVPQEQDEIQASMYMDTQSCTNQACSNSIDTQGNWLLANNKIPQDKVSKLEKIGFIKNERFNTSARDNAILSGTNGGLDPNRPKGNYLYKPWDSARNDGMIPEWMLPITRDMKLAEYYQPQLSAEKKAQIQEARELFKSIFLIQYEIIPTDPASRKYHLKHAPITIISGVCSGWNGNNVIPACSISSGHATDIYGGKENEYWKDLDSYKPFEKKLAWDYLVGYAIKGVVTLRDTQRDLHYDFTKPMKLGDKGEHVKMYQIALFLEGTLQDSEWPTREHVQKWGGYFGENTKEATKRFQKKYGIAQTGEVWYQTLSKLNQLYS